MKYQITIVFLLLASLSYSQCEIRKQLDKFEDHTVYLTNETRMSKFVGSAPVEFTFFQLCIINDKMYLAIKDRTRKVQSTFDSGKVILLFKDGSKIQLQSTIKDLSKNQYLPIAQMNQWVNLLSCPITIDQALIINKKTITATRIKYDSFNKDFEVGKKPAKEIKEYAECLIDLIESE